MFVPILLNNGQIWQGFHFMMSSTITTPPRRFIYFLDFRPDNVTFQRGKLRHFMVQK